MLETKQCPQCNKIKNLSEFNFRNDTNKFRNNCKLCQYSAQKNWRCDNPNYREKGREYYSKNKKSILENKRKYWINNKEKINQYRESNKVSLYASRKKYIETEEYRVADRVRQKERRALKKSTSDKTITVESLSVLLEAQNNKCYHCSCDLDNKKHLDHYVPLKNGGTHSISNVVWSCAKCNTSKQATQPTILMLI